MQSMTSFGEVDTSKKVTAAFGIDLGTTNSCIAVIPHGETPEIVPLNDNRITLPSCVRWDGGDKFTVGIEAYNDRYRHYTSYSVKRLMGRGELVKFSRGSDTLELTPVEISSKILSELVSQAKQGLYKDISDVVITVPAYFDNNQVLDTIKAGEMAGLNVLEIMREPTAAALQYNQSELEVNSKEILVYDLGGGTFDISVIRISKGAAEVDTDLLDLYGIDTDDAVTSSKETMFSVIAQDGDMLLGGDDIDQAMYDIVIEKLKGNRFNVNAITYTEREKLILELERLKKCGPGMYLIKTKLGNKPVEITLDASDMYAAFKTVFDKTHARVSKVLTNPAVGKIDQIVTVGGSTKSPILQQMLQEAFPNIHINSNLNPDESVALGASVQAKRLKFGNSNVNIFESLSLGIGVLSNDRIRTIVPSGTQIPVQRTEFFTTTEDNQAVIYVDVYQGNSNMSENCVQLGRLTIDGIAAKPAGKTSIAVTMQIDSNGQLTAKTTVGEQEVQLQLVNILGAKTKGATLTLEDRRSLRWKKYVENFIGPQKAELESSLAQYLAGEITPEEMSKMISDTKEEVAPIVVPIETPTEVTFKGQVIR